MSQAPSMPMFWDAYLADTTHLTTEEHGAYLLLLAAMWRRNGFVTDDDRDVARILGMTPAKWRKTKDRLSALLIVQDGQITQKNLLKIWKITQEKIEKNRENGAKGGRPKTRENNGLGKPNGYVSLNPNDNPNETIPEPEPDKEEVAAAVREREGDDLHSKVMHVVGLTSGRIPVHWMPPAATMHVGRWVTDLGLTEDEILETARHSRARHADPPAGPKALDRAMQATAAAKIAPTMQPAKGYSNGKPMSETRAFDSAMRQLASKMADGTAALETDSRDPWLYADAVLRDTKPGQH